MREIMSLYQMYQQSKPCYRCKESIREFTKDTGGTITRDFYIMREYPIEYVEQSVPYWLINKYFEKLT
jgi:transposase-like protein